MLLFRLAPPPCIPLLACPHPLVTRVRKRGVSTPQRRQARVLHIAVPPAHPRTSRSFQVRRGLSDDPGHVRGAPPRAQMTLAPMAASVMAVAEPKWVPLWGRLLWVTLLSMALGSLLALLLPLSAVEEQRLALLRGFSLLRSHWDRAQHAGSRCSSPCTELSVTARDAGLLVVKAPASPGKTERPSALGSWGFVFMDCGTFYLSVTVYVVCTLFKLYLSGKHWLIT